MTGETDILDRRIIQITPPAEPSWRAVIVEYLSRDGEPMRHHVDEFPVVAWALWQWETEPGSVPGTRRRGSGPA